MKTFLKKKMEIINKNIEKSLNLFKMKLPFFSHWFPRINATPSKMIIKVKKGLESSEKKQIKDTNFKGSSYQGKGKVNKDAKWFNHPRKDVPSGREGN